MEQYICNTGTSQLLYSENGTWGAQYTESTGAFPGVSIFKPPWRLATQEEIDAYLLAQTKSAKTAELLEKFGAYECGGFEYEDNIFCLKQEGISNIVDVKSNVDPGDPNRYKFSSINGEQINFVTLSAWDAFKQVICTKRDHIMVYYVDKKVEIGIASSVVEVDAIIIDFSQA